MVAIRLGGLTMRGKIQQSELRYVESVSPGHGFAPARASGAGGSTPVSLGRLRKFLYGQGLGDLTPGFEAVDFDDGHFDDITVPSSWQLAGVPGPPRYGSPPLNTVASPPPLAAARLHTQTPTPHAAL